MIEGLFMKLDILIDTGGWIGAVLILTAYFLVSTRKLTGDATTYQLMNLVGGLLLVINTIYYGAYPSSGVNLVWIGIAAYTMIKTKTALEQPLG